MKQEGDQSIFKMGVKRWLKEQNLDYKWMADQCGVSEITVRNWMSQKIIPPLKQQLIEQGDGSDVSRATNIISQFHSRYSGRRFLVSVG